ncbi:MAG: ECF transporter S component [Oscillospiraceae bacterium]|nr:ECF transporter S component [Oscillospiraceae bacterium]
MKINAEKMAAAALLTAAGFIISYVFHVLGMSRLGIVLLPLHIPVIICGFVCGARYGGLCGAAIPIFAMLFNGLPPFIGIPMIFELCLYGVVSGLAYKKLNVFGALIAAMFAGRLAGGLASAAVAALGLANMPFSLSVFLTAYFVTPLLGIVIQLILIPAVILALQKARVLQSPNQTAPSSRE